MIMLQTGEYCGVTGPAGASKAAASCRSTVSIDSTMAPWCYAVRLGCMQLDILVRILRQAGRSGRSL